jgi:hypothetical protein
MPKFIGTREKKLFNRVQNELLRNVVPVQVKYIQRVELTDVENDNPYHEVMGGPEKVFDTSKAFDILALVRMVDPEVIEELTGVRYQRTVNIHITREELEKNKIGEPKIGDYIYYWGEYWEIVKLNYSNYLNNNPDEFFNYTMIAAL